MKFWENWIKNCKAGNPNSKSLGPTHKTVTNNGSVTSTTLYKAWGVGNVRSISACVYQSGTLPTDKTYTGQRRDRH